MTTGQKSTIESAIERMRIAHKREKQRKNSAVRTGKDRGYFETGEKLVQLAKISKETPFIDPEYRAATTDFINAVEPILRQYEAEEEMLLEEAETTYRRQLSQIRAEYNRAIARHRAAQGEYRAAIVGDFNELLRYRPAPDISVNIASRSVSDYGGWQTPVFQQLRREIEDGKRREKQLAEEEERKRFEEAEKAEKKRREHAKKEAERKASERSRELLPSEIRVEKL